jgi:hypothetical protein
MIRVPIFLYLKCQNSESNQKTAMMDCTGTCHHSPNNHIGKRSNKVTDFSVVWKLKGYILLNSQNIQINSARPILVMNAKTSEVLPWSWA